MGPVCSNQFKSRQLWSPQSVGVLPGCGSLFFTRSARRRCPESPEGPHAQGQLRPGEQGVGFVHRHCEKRRFRSHHVTAPCQIWKSAPRTAVSATPRLGGNTTKTALAFSELLMCHRDSGGKGQNPSERKPAARGFELEPFGAGRVGRRFWKTVFLLAPFPWKSLLGSCGLSEEFLF